MAPIRSAEDAQMILDLSQDLGDDFWSAVPSPDPSPAKPRPAARILSAIPRTPTKGSKAQKASTGANSAGSALSTTVFAATNHDLASFLEGSEDWNMDDDIFSPIKSSASKTQVQAPTKSTVPRYIPNPCTRCVVESVEDEYIDNRWRKKILSKVEKTQERVIVYLCDDWYHNDIRIDDIFNVIGKFADPPFSASSSQLSSQPKRSISITSQSNLFILHPDLLLTATALSNAPSCRRKPLLSAMVRSTTDITPALVWGNMLHEVMQRCLTENRWDEAFVETRVGEAVQAGLGELVKIGLGEEIAKREVSERARGMRAFADKYLAQEPKSNATLTSTRAGQYDEPSLLAITCLLDIEEDIWSPTYGIKGKLDATVQGTISDPAPASASTSSYNPLLKPRTPSSPIARTLSSTPLPLELKTGRATTGMEHRAQTMLYTLLLSERYGVDVQDGLLFYTQAEAGEVIRVPRGRNEVRGLVGVRNELAGVMWRRVRKPARREKDKDKDKDKVEVKMDVEVEGPAGSSQKSEGGSAEEDELEDEEPFLPPPIDDERACKRCYVLDTCLLFRKTHPNHSWPSSTPPAALPLSAAPLSAAAKAKARATFDPPVPAFLADVFAARTGHLTPLQVAFFRRWERLLALEERDLVRFKRELWTLGAGERERLGRCFAGMVLKEGKGSGIKVEDGDGDGEDEEEVKEKWGTEQKIHRFTYAFGRSRTWAAAPSPPSSQRSSHSQPSTQGAPASQPAAGVKGSLLNAHLNVGDPITVSVEPNMLALARGYVLELTPEEVVLGVDHVLDVGTLRARLARARFGAGVGQDQDGGKDEEEEGEEEELVFRIDKDELFGGMARVRNNLAMMFYAGGDTKRLQLVVDLKTPLFSEPTPPFSAAACPAPSELTAPVAKRPLAPHLARLNPSQLAAMAKVLSAEDYALVLGMPGTGKTTVIAALIRELVGRGKTVLLSSYTHSAVDTILMKLQGLWKDEGEVGVGGEGEVKSADVGFGILRLGNVDKVHPDVRKYTINARRTATTVEQLELQFMSPPVVATTCLSIEHPVFSRRRFDYCIVDEASQITLPTCIGPLRFADTFVLVGDHFQLPPLVKNQDARKGGLDVSLFRRLSEAHPEAVVDLRFQYRMNRDIMLLSNHLIYDHRLRCGNDEVANRSLKLRNRKWLRRLHQGRDGDEGCVGGGGGVGGGAASDRCWLERLADEQCKIAFVDTDALPAHDSRVGDLVQNTTEAELVRQLTETLIQCGVHESQIGIISLYRQQVKLLQHLLPERKGVEMLTADKSQGRDKDCIIISLVRSNEAGLVGDLVKDWRRMNVSFTRARKKLVIFGSRKTLGCDPLLAQFFDLMQTQKWILSLPPNAHLAHASVFNVSPSSSSSSPAKRALGADDDAGENKSDGGPGAAVRRVGKENAVVAVGVAETRPVKKLKVGSDVGKAGAGAGILKGRPILRDLVGNET